MSLLRAFPPVADARARCLILGSMPGVASLDAVEYYAHPRNAFWRIMGDLIGAGADLPYAQRLDKLCAAGIALWDVVAACERPGSLDTAIVPETVRVNDFAAFLAAHPGIERIFFNGGAAEALFRRHVLRQLDGSRLTLLRLPSTSPAHAARAYADKLTAWSAILAASPNPSRAP